MEQILNNAVTFYCELLYYSMHNRAQTNLFTDYLHFDDHIFRKSYQALAYKIYTLLIKEELITEPPVDLSEVTAKKLKRRQKREVIETIQETFDENPTVALDIFQAALNMLEVEAALEKARKARGRKRFSQDTDVTDSQQQLLTDESDLGQGTSAFQEVEMPTQRRSAFREINTPDERRAALRWGGISIDRESLLRGINLLTESSIDLKSLGLIFQEHNVMMATLYSTEPMDVAMRSAPITLLIDFFEEKDEDMLLSLEESLSAEFPHEVKVRTDSVNNPLPESTSPENLQVIYEDHQRSLYYV